MQNRVKEAGCHDEIGNGQPASKDEERRAKSPKMKLSLLISIFNFTLIYQPILFSLTSWYSWTCSMPLTSRDELLSTRKVPSEDWQRTEIPISLKKKVRISQKWKFVNFAKNC